MTLPLIVFAQYQNEILTTMKDSNPICRLES